MAAARVERGDLWKSNALSVQRWLREQFRVEVDRRFRHHPIFSDGYFASTVQRWLQRFRDFKRDSLPSSIANEIAVGKEINAEEESVILRMVQAVAVPVIGNVYGSEKLHDALLRRPKDRPLITQPYMRVTVVIGDPIYFDDLLNNEGAKHLSRGKLYDAVSSRIGHRLRQLKVQVDKLTKGTQLLNDGSLIEETPELVVAGTQEPRSFDRFRVGFSKDGWIASRMRSFMEPTELMGFAARGLFVNRRAVETSESGSRRVGPLKAWNQFLEANVLPRWNCA